MLLVDSSCVFDEVQVLFLMLRFSIGCKLVMIAILEDPWCALDVFVITTLLLYSLAYNKDSLVRESFEILGSKVILAATF